MPKQTDYGSLLREHSLKTTPRRVYLLSLLAKAKKPLGAYELKEAWEHGNTDVVTLYRALEALASAGIIRRVNLQHGHADYEIIVPGKHHHHLVCTECGAIEDIDLPTDKKIEKEAIAASKEFASVSDHELVLFGTCKTCVTV